MMHQRIRDCLKNGLILGTGLGLSSGLLIGWAPDSAFGQSSETSTQDDKTPSFVCEPENGQYTIMYQPKSRPGQSYPWATPGEMGGGWTEARRCEEIARRLEFYRPDGLLELQTSIENGYDIVCVTTEDNPTCRIVFTVPPGQDALGTRDRVFENIAMANSGEQTQSVYTFQDRGGSNILGQLGEILNIDLSEMGGRSRSPQASINLRPFLAPEDGGTGLYLQGNTPSPGRQLNPEDFR